MHNLLRQTAWAFGLILLFVGLIGFIAPGVHGPSGAYIGFAPDTLRNLFYIAIGAVGVFTVFEDLPFTEAYLLVIGVLFAAIAFDGFVWNGTLFNILPFYPLDHYFHMFIGSFALVVSLWEMEQHKPKKRVWRK